MAPRKKSSTSTTRKSNQNQQPSQPSKFGIQHFFERHSQSQAAASSSSTPPNPNPKPDRAADPPPAANGDENSSQISPEISKSVPLKRFKFSPGLLIKQSQDDGGDEITWKISPVNERLKSLTAKQLPRLTRISSEAPKLNSLALQPCSEKQVQSSSCSVESLEKWLSSPTTLVPDRSLNLSKRGFSQEMGSNGGVNSLGSVEFQNPFRTPPSMSYGPTDMISDVACNGGHHRKALLDLLDQVEDAITDETVPIASVPCEDHGETSGRIECDSVERSVTDTTEKINSGYPDEIFLVLEVSEKHKNDGVSCSQNPFKILRLLNERSGQERSLYLCDEWFHSLIGPGDTVNVIGEFDGQARCVVDHNSNLVIIHPDILVSGTRVASSFYCPRRSILDERLKCAEYSTSALIGTLLHQIFQAGLVKDLPTREFLEEYAGIVLQKNIESLYASGADENVIYSTLLEAAPRILNWLRCFREPEESKCTTVDYGNCEGQKAVHITEVIDIEEMAWAPKYGLKGMIDASVRVKMTSSCGNSHETIVPLEFKTGKGTTGQSAMDHCAQVILYTLLMSERYLKKDIDSGLLYYLHTDQTRGIKVQRSDLIGLIMRRNELASDILKASSTQLLPPMLQNLTTCRSCRHLNICAIYHKANGGNTESSGLGDLFNERVGHLTAAHSDFLKHWDRLIDLEAKVPQATKKEILHPHGLRGERSTNSLSSIILDLSNGFSLHEPLKNGRFIYNFMHQKKHHCHHEMHNGVTPDPSEPGVSGPDCTLKCGDHVILSTESGHIAVANGIICGISPSNISISFARRLRLPSSDSSSELGNLTREVWRIDKDEISSSFAVMRFNLIQLFVQSSHSSHLRKMIVDLEPPRFDSGGMFSQDPALSYVRSEKSLNDDQRRAIHKILTAKDYTLILGMPGTGKTSTMVHAIKALLMRGASILLTSYTNSAVDNLLIKLKAQGIDFVRIGRHEVVHVDVRGHCFPVMETRCINDIKQRMEHVRVVGVTCLGINHPLLANKQFDICIMDEAGQTTLPVSLGPLMLASSFVLVGDHYQLPPLVQSAEARDNGMATSLFCRLSEAHPQAISPLQCQYRMCSGIMELSNALIYGNRLRCGSSEIANAKLIFSSAEPIKLWLKEVWSYLDPYHETLFTVEEPKSGCLLMIIEVYQVLDPNRPVVFISTDQLPAPEVKEQKAVNNPMEAHIVSEVTGELRKRGVSGDEIGIITPYNSQANFLRRVLDASVEIHTIDKYQGRDKDCILVSFVRSSENSRACTSSLLGDWHRINVALTRAKKKLIMVGSCRTLSKVPLLKLLIEKVEEQDGILQLSSKDFCHLKEMKKCLQQGAKSNDLTSC